MLRRRVADVARVALLLAASAICFLVTAATPGQAGEVDGSLFKSVEACQRVAKKHAVLADSTVRDTLRQFAATFATMEGYLRQWGSRVAAGGDAVVAVGVASCQRDFEKEVRRLADEMEDKLGKSVSKQEQWYDEKVFRLFTEDLTDEGRASIVQTVKGNLEPTLKVFANEAFSTRKQSTKDLKPIYQAAAKCIRDQSLQAEDIIENH